MKRIGPQNKPRDLKMIPKEISFFEKEKQDILVVFFVLGLATHKAISIQAQKGKESPYFDLLRRCEFYQFRFDLSWFYLMCFFFNSFALSSVLFGI